MNSEDELTLHAEDVSRLREGWRTRIMECHEQMFSLLEQICPRSANQMDALATISEAARNIAGVDFGVAASGALYTKHLDEVRHYFRMLFRGIDALRRSAQAERDDYILVVVEQINVVACAMSNIDCFRSLLNGYVDNIR